MIVEQRASSSSLRPFLDPILKRKEADTSLSKRIYVSKVYVTEFDSKQ